MRTTVTLETDTEAMLRRTMASRRLTFKQALNEAIRRGLQPPGNSKSQPYRVKTFRSGFLPGVDPSRLNQLSDQLEVEEYGHRAMDRDA